MSCPTNQSHLEIAGHAGSPPLVDARDKHFPIYMMGVVTCGVGSYG